MSIIDPRAAQRFQSDLTSGETIYWAGMPNPSVIFHSDDWIEVPVSLLWTGFAVFWEGSALGLWEKSSGENGMSIFMVVWGIPFVIFGNYFMWGRFLTDAWLKRRTYYAVTNTRVLVLQEGWKKKTSVAFLRHIPTILREGAGIGTLWFGPKPPFMAGRGGKTRGWSHFHVGEIPVFADIDDVDSVHRLVMDLRTKERGEQAPTWGFQST